jgi:Tol biopolymer transport system component
MNPRGYALGNFAIAPDGRTLAFLAGPSDRTSLSLLVLATGEHRPLAGTQKASYPFWAPDSRTIGFFAEGKLKRIDAAGGAPQVVCDALQGRGGSWSVRDEILFEASYDQPLSVVPAAGGRPRPVTAFDASRHETGHKWPHFLPDGRRFIYFAGTNGGPDAIFGGILDTKEKHLIVETQSSAAFVPPHWLLYATPDHILVARTFDPGSFALSGAPVALAGRVQVDPLRWNAEFSVSPTGILAYEGRGPTVSRLAILDENGREARSVGRPEPFNLIAISPDGSRACLEGTDDRKGTDHLWMADFARGAISGFTSNEHEDQSPVWSADGRFIYFGRNAGKSSALYVKDADGSAPERLVLSAPEEREAQDVTPDGRRLVFSQRDPANGSDLWTMSTSGEADPRPLLRTPAWEGGARLSPDGRWYFYSSNETGEPEVYVRPFPSGAGKWQISTHGGIGVAWRRDGRRIFFLTEKKLMAADVDFDHGFHEGAPREVFPPGTEFESIAVFPDGKTFAVLRKVEEGPGSIEAVVNWTALLDK